MTRICIHSHAFPMTDDYMVRCLPEQNGWAEDARAHFITVARNGHTVLQNKGPHSIVPSTSGSVITNFTDKIKTCRSYAVGAPDCMTIPLPLPGNLSVLGPVTTIWPYGKFLSFEEESPVPYKPARSWK